MNSIKDIIQERLSAKVLNWYEHSALRIYISISPKDLKEAANVLFRELNLRFIIASGQETLEGLEILYHFSFDQSGEIFSLRVLIKDKKKPQIDSLAPLFVAAEWIEREMWELLGINFIGHPNLKRLLLSEEWPEGKCPLRHQE